MVPNFSLRIIFVSYFLKFYCINLLSNALAQWLKLFILPPALICKIREY